MKLMDAQDGLVVRNERNGHFYRFVRREGRRVRIRPLELFPNGLLQEKTTDTIVEPDLEVAAIGDWTEGLYVQARSSKSRATYERELAKAQDDLLSLEAEMLVISPKERGSHANKIKSKAVRIDTLRKGLADRPEDTGFTSARTVSEIVEDAFKEQDLVLLPSDRPAKLLKIVRSPDKTVASLVTRNDQGELHRCELPVHTLVPYRHARMASV